MATKRHTKHVTVKLTRAQATALKHALGSAHTTRTTKSHGRKKLYGAAAKAHAKKRARTRRRRSRR